MTNQQASKINEYKAYFTQLLPVDLWLPALRRTKEDIRFLESIYQTGGEHNRYSRQFQDAAAHERNELCLKTSALHSLLREKKATP